MANRVLLTKSLIKFNHKNLYFTSNFKSNRLSFQNRFTSLGPGRGQARDGGMIEEGRTGSKRCCPRGCPVMALFSIFVKLAHKCMQCKLNQQSEWMDIIKDGRFSKGNLVCTNTALGKAILLNSINLMFTRRSIARNQYTIWKN